MNATLCFAATTADPGWVLVQLFLIFFLILLAGFFTAAELAFFKTRPSQLEPALERGDRRAKRASSVLENYESHACTCQVGSIGCYLVLGGWGIPFVASLLLPVWSVMGVTILPLSVTVSLLISCLLIGYFAILLGGMLPRALAARHPLGVALFSAPAITFFRFLLRPFLWLMELSAGKVVHSFLRAKVVTEGETSQSEEEIREILLESEESAGGPESLEREILKNALDLKHRVVCDIMTPRGEVIFLDLEVPFEDQITVAIESRHTRFPLCKGHIDEAVGLVHIKDLLALFRKGNKDLLSVRRELFHVSEMMPLEKLLRFFLSKRAHLAVVVDEYGGSVGIVTLDNVLEELVGTIHDEFDAVEENPVRKIGDDEFDVDASMALYEIGELLDMELESSEASTIGGYLTAELGHIPQKGESLPVGEFLATVTESDTRRVIRVHFKKRLTPSSDEAAA